MKTACRSGPTVNVKDVTNSSCYDRSGGATSKRVVDTSRVVGVCYRGEDRRSFADYREVNAIWDVVNVLVSGAG